MNKKKRKNLAIATGVGAGIGYASGKTLGGPAGQLYAANKYLRGNPITEKAVKDLVERRTNQYKNQVKNIVKRIKGQKIENVIPKEPELSQKDVLKDIKRTKKAVNILPAMFLGGKSAKAQKLDALNRAAMTLESIPRYSKKGKIGVGIVSGIGSTLATAKLLEKKAATIPVHGAPKGRRGPGGVARVNMKVSQPPPTPAKPIVTAGMMKKFKSKANRNQVGSLMNTGLAKQASLRRLKYGVSSY